MKKLYLIRRGVEGFVGPMSLSELRAAYSKMQFGAQDEIAGSCQSWITIERQELLRRHYPEVASFIYQESANSWGGSDHVSGVAASGSAAAQSIRMRTILVAFAYLLACALAVWVAFQLARNLKLSGKLAPEDREASLAVLESYIETGNLRDFATAMERQLPSLLPKLQKSRIQTNQWLPLLRTYAFYRDGEVPGFSQSILRGNVVTPVAGALPSECTVKYWKGRWQNSSQAWVQLSSGKAVPRTHWATLLLLDPNWTKRRSVHGWRLPQNFYAACIMTGYKGFQAAIADISRGETAATNATDKSIRDSLERRLRFLQARTLESFAIDSESLRPMAQAVSGDGFSILSCMEYAGSMAQLQGCRSIGDGLTGQWPVIIDLRFRWNQFRLGLTGQVVDLPAAMAMVLEQNYSRKMDPIAFYDIAAELELAKQIRKEPGNIDPDWFVVRSDSVEIDFRK